MNEPFVSGYSFSDCHYMKATTIKTIYNVYLYLIDLNCLVFYFKIGKNVI